MDAVKFLKERNRMCENFGDRCAGCPAFNVREGYVGCCAVDVESTMDATAQVAIVEKWSKENPRKTRQSIFLEQYPNAKCVDGVSVLCPRWIDTCFSCLIDDNNNVDCATCRHEFWSQEVK